jgi:hypothetical protein
MSAASPVAIVAAFVVATCLAAGLAASSAQSGSAAPMPSPDGINDAPSAGKGSFALIDNFAWRAFIALNWPRFPTLPIAGSRTDRSPGDEGKRVWETFKSDYELFPDRRRGRRAAPRPWTSYDGRNPCGEIDNREKTVASFEPFADFNQPSFTVDVPANPLVSVSGAYTRYEIYFNEAEFSAFSANGWSEAGTCPTRAIRCIFRRARSRSSGRRGCR